MIRNKIVNGVGSSLGPGVLLGVFSVGGCLGFGALTGLATGDLAGEVGEGLFAGLLAWVTVMAVFLTVAVVRADGRAGHR